MAKIVKKLGEGGFGVTYLIELDGERYAMKEMEHRDAVEEYAIMKRVASDCASHHILCPVELLHTPSHDYDYLVSDYISGTDLSKVFKRRDLITRGFVTKFITQMLDALETLHKHGIAHRDIKAENIMVCPKTQTFTLIDLGLGTARGSRSPEGTMLYVSPQVYALAKEHRPIPMDVLFSSDLFGFGVTLYELLERGKYPFKIIADDVDRTTTFTKDTRRIPYDSTHVYDLTNPVATRWMDNLFMTTVEEHDYKGLYTAKGLRKAIAERDYKRLSDAATR